jgi:hypothetical protein
MMHGQFFYSRIVAQGARAVLALLALVPADSLGAQVRPDSLTLQSVYRQIEEGTPRIAAALATA